MVSQRMVRTQCRAAAVGSVVGSVGGAVVGAVIGTVVSVAAGLEFVSGERVVFVVSEGAVVVSVLSVGAVVPAGAVVSGWSGLLFRDSS